MYDDDEVKHEAVSNYLLKAVSRTVGTMSHLSLGEFNNLQRLVEGKYVPYQQLASVAKKLGWVET